MKKYLPYLQFIFLISAILAGYVQKEFIQIVAIALITCYLNHQLYICVYAPDSRRIKFPIYLITIFNILAIIIQFVIFIKFH